MRITPDCTVDLRPKFLLSMTVRHSALVTGACLAMVGLALGISGCSQPPQFGSAEAMKSADALYTAVTSRRTSLLDQVERQLLDLRTSGKLTEEPAAVLDGIIQTARSGEWQGAAEELDALIRHQPVSGHHH